MTNFKNSIRVFAGLTFMALAACSGDDEKPVVRFNSGIVVVNEGNFKSGDGTLSFFTPSTKTAQLDIFGAVNNKMALGDVLQSATIAGDFAYMVVNNSNKVVIADANTLLYSKTIEGVSLPRYMTSLNGKGYVTEWVSFSRMGRVTVLDLATNTLSDTITTGYGTENAIAYNGRIYVSNNFSNDVMVIDPSINAIVDTITVSGGPGEFAVDKNDALWVICGGDYMASNGALCRINTLSGDVTTVGLGMNITPKLAQNKEKDVFYYFNGTGIYKVGIGAETGPSEPFISESDAIGFYGIGVEPSTDIIYGADARGFLGNGSVFRYDASGEKIDTFESGRGPNGFIFR